MPQKNTALLVIPARFGSKRFPGKPLAKILQREMILHVIDRACETQLGKVIVATDNKSIEECVNAQIKNSVWQSDVGVIMTREDHPSGSDRIYEAVQKSGATNFDYIINLQGDYPAINPQHIKLALQNMNEDEKQQIDVMTLACPLISKTDIENENIVKVSATEISKTHHRALYFSRAAIPWGGAEKYHHIGLYIYRPHSLEQFISHKPTKLELSEKLEQLRLLEMGKRIDVTIVDSAPHGVDTPQDIKSIEQQISEK